MDHIKCDFGRRIFQISTLFYLAIVKALSSQVTSKEDQRVRCRVSGFFAPMALEAWLLDESRGDHQHDTKELLSLDELAKIGILYWRVDPKDHENSEELKKIRESRGYTYMDLLEICPGKLENYEQKLKNFFQEHIHADEEIRYCLEGSGYFDVRNKADKWIRIWIKEGDLIVLPAGIYHRFTLDSLNYVKLMRLFVGEPVWTAHYRPQEGHPARKEYIKNLGIETH